jgi:putative photosynthetic complex assembly protein 2
MRQSAKLNIFLGVRNLGESFLPEHLSYLKSYFRCRPMNWLFPISVTVATGAAIIAWWQLSEATDAFRITGLALVGTMLALGALEHWLLVLPIPSDVLWRWGLRSRKSAVPAALPVDTAPATRSRLV